MDYKTLQNINLMSLVICPFIHILSNYRRCENGHVGDQAGVGQGANCFF